MSITKRHFGITPEGENVDIFTLKNANGVTAEIMNYGGIVVSLAVPDRKGQLEDVVLGFSSLEEYLADHPFFGALVGRHANRLENAEFELNGVSYKLAKNDGKNHLHGGLKGFDKVVWKGAVIRENDKDYLELTYFSADGEENYPGNLNVRVRYALSEDNSLSIDYYATTDKDTVVNLTNHSYFNLSGHKSGSILKQTMMINADFFTPINSECIPTGEIRSVEGTPMDFRKPVPIENGLNGQDEQIINGGGYDHNWVLNKKGNGLEKAAEVFDEHSGRVMEVFTTKPGIQFYSANSLDGSLKGKEGAVYGKRSGLCLETQYFPNSMKHKHFPTPVLNAGQEYRHSTIYKFSAR